MMLRNTIIAREKIALDDVTRILKWPEFSNQQILSKYPLNGTNNGHDRTQVLRDHIEDFIKRKLRGIRYISHKLQRMDRILLLAGLKQFQL